VVGFNLPSQFFDLGYVNHVNLLQRAEILIPRAVGYSSGVINHFFKNRISVKQDGKGMVITNISGHSISGEIRIFWDDSKGYRNGVQIVGNGQINLGAGKSQKIDFYGDISYLQASVKDKFYAILSNGSGATAAVQFTYAYKSPPKCNSNNVAGSNEPETRTIEMGKLSGTTH
jgi:hypothetical protein